MFPFRTTIPQWIARELHATAMALLQAEDELANAQLRVKALRSRAARLSGKQHKNNLPVVERVAIIPESMIYRKNRP